MRRPERHASLLRAASRYGVLYLPRAVELTGASPATVRRDFDALSDSGAVERIRGGLRVVEREGNLPFGLRQVQHAKAKQALARFAASFLSPGDTVFVDGGTTTFALASVLPPIPLHIITNSLHLANALNEARPAVERKVYLTGGFLDPDSGIMYGLGAVHGLGFYHADWAFLSVRGVTADGFYNTSESVVETERAMMERADRTFVLADASKLGKRGMFHLCGAEAVDRLITQADDATAGEADALRRSGLRVDTV